MDARTLKALKGSIKKWEGIVAGTGEDNGADNCDLCAEFFLRDCDGCPVKAATGVHECNDSPYRDWRAAVNERDRDKVFRTYKATDDCTVMCAVLELEFLKGLLP